MVIYGVFTNLPHQFNSFKSIHDLAVHLELIDETRQLIHF